MQAMWRSSPPNCTYHTLYATCSIAIALDCHRAGLADLWTIKCALIVRRDKSPRQPSLVHIINTSGASRQRSFSNEARVGLRCSKHINPSEPDITVVFALHCGPRSTRLNCRDRPLRPSRTIHTLLGCHVVVFADLPSRFG